MKKRLLISTLIITLFICNFVLAAVPPVAANHKTFTVSPSGGDDTASIQAAFDAAVAAGPGATVELTVGQFYCSNIYVENFRGTFKGAGQSLTFIDTIRGLDPDLPGLDDFIGDDFARYFFGFKDGDIRIMDMTFEITAASPGEPWYIWGEEVQFIEAVVRITGDIRSSVERVSFIGHDGSYEELGATYNTNNALIISGIQAFSEVGFRIGPMTGTHKVSGCTFEHLCGGVAVDYLVDGRLSVTDCAFNGPHSNAMFIADLVNSVIEIAHNQFSGFNWAAIPFYQGIAGAVNGGPEAYLGPLPANGLCLIHDNIIQAPEGAIAIDLEDYGYFLGFDESLNAMIKDNDISLGAGASGIYGFIAQNVRAINNRFTGIGTVGIYLDMYCSKWVVNGNMFEGLDASFADVYLSPDTSHCVVVVDEGTNVIDESFDNIVVMH